MRYEPMHTLEKYQPLPPGIKYYRVLPAVGSDGEEIDWQSILADQQVLITIRERECVWYKIAEVFSNGCALRFSPHPSVQPEYRLNSTNEKFRNTDSSGPSFIFVNGEPIVVSLNWTRGSLLEPGPGTASFLSSKLNFNRINYLMSILDNSGQLNPIKIR
ncbi:hypothetical protein N8640_02175 [Akkermansiaceae bacterium]|nr:hypothetical protein [Akkermansiaceae bacterium]MDB4622804.1 hypothetical protein [Akkermansiaceae bacterium]